MATYEVRFWTTEELHLYGDGDPEQAIKDFMDKTLQEIDGNGVSVKQGDKHPNPPHESLGADHHWPEDAPHPCDGTTTTFSDLLDWWDDWHACKANYDAKDCNMIVTNYDSTAGVFGGGCTGASPRAVAEGHRVGKLNSEAYSARGCEVRYSQMYATVLHELGHAISTGDCGGGGIAGCSCNNSEWEDELCGYSYYDTTDGNNYTTPMVTWSSDTLAGKNECCTDLTSDKSQGDECFEREYSDCRKEWAGPC
jgi:hypothetical protein